MKSKEDVIEYDNIAENVFYPVYSIIAEQIKSRTGISSGRCIDIGSCGGHLGIELANVTELSVCLFDISEHALEAADKRISDKGLEDRVCTLLGDVHSIPAEDESFDIAVSRGSYWKWEDKVKALREVYRILKPGGCAYIGGGFGTKELHEMVDAKMQEYDPKWRAKKVKRRDGNCTERYEEVLKEAGIDTYEVIEDESGLWVYFKKV